MILRSNTVYVTLDTGLVSHRNVQIPCKFNKINYFLASGNFYQLLINIANGLDPDQVQLNVGSNLGPNRFAL